MLPKKWTTKQQHATTHWGVLQCNTSKSQLDVLHLHLYIVWFVRTLKCFPSRQQWQEGLYIMQGSLTSNEATWSTKSLSRGATQYTHQNNLLNMLHRIIPEKICTWKVKQTAHLGFSHTKRSNELTDISTRRCNAFPAQCSPETESLVHVQAQPSKSWIAAIHPQHHFGMEACDETQPWNLQNFDPASKHPHGLWRDAS